MRCRAALLLAMFTSALASAQIFVAPHGSDSNSGLSARRPVLTLKHALELSRTSHQRKIVLADGAYRLTAPLRLTPRDAGLIVTAAPGAHPVISGAVRIQGWREVDLTRHLWSAKVPESVTNSRQLYVNGVRAWRTHARVPVELTETPTGYTAADSTMASWKNPSDIEFVYTGGNSIWSEHSEGLGSWTEPRCPIASIQGTAVTMAQPCWDNSTKRVMLPNGARTANLVGPMSVGKHPEYVENAYELLGTPGQWYFDRPAHTLYYVPRPGEDLKTADVEMPVLETLIEASGTPEAPIANLAFSGLQFSYATWLGRAATRDFLRFRPITRLPAPTATRGRRSAIWCRTARVPMARGHRSLAT